MIIGGSTMKFKRRLLPLLLSASIILSFSACSAQTATNTVTGSAEKVLGMKTADYYNWKLSGDGTYWYVTDVYYVESPVDSTYQTMSIFVPASYMKHSFGKTTISRKDINGFTAKTAPILFKSESTGYKEGKASDSPDTQAIKDGFIYVSAGHRGQGTTAIGADGKAYYDGKSPWSLIDIKAAIRYLRFNDNAIPGDAEKIVASDGGDGAMAALLASCGNDPIYNNYLKEAGAIMSVGDQVFASNCYNPMINLDNADSAYEWIFGADSLSDAIDSTAFQAKLAEHLSDEFISYLSFLGYTEEDIKNVLTKQLEWSANCYFKEVSGGQTSISWTDKAIFKSADSPTLKEIAENYIAGYYSIKGTTGKNISTWLSWDDSTQTAVITSLAAVEDYFGRTKSVTAFDGLNGKASENQAFGSNNEDYRHFSSVVLDVLADNYNELENLWADADSSNTGYASYSALYAAYKADVSNDDIDEYGNNIVNLYNPMLFIDSNTNYLNGDTAKYVRIRTGAANTGTALPLTTLLGLALEKAGINVSIEYVWGGGNGITEQNNESLYDWITQICAKG